MLFFPDSDVSSDNSSDSDAGTDDDSDNNNCAKNVNEVAINNIINAPNYKSQRSREEEFVNFLDNASEEDKLTSLNEIYKYYRPSELSELEIISDTEQVKKVSIESIERNKKGKIKVKSSFAAKQAAEWDFINEFNKLINEGAHREIEGQVHSLDIEHFLHPQSQAIPIPEQFLCKSVDPDWILWWHKKGIELKELKKLKGPKNEMSVCKKIHNGNELKDDHILKSKDMAGQSTFPIMILNDSNMSIEHT